MSPKSLSRWADEDSVGGLHDTLLGSRDERATLTVQSTAKDNRAIYEY